jgi:hypothetical protein
MRRARSFLVSAVGIAAILLLPGRGLAGGQACSWTTVPSPGLRLSFDDVSATSDSDAWAVGNRGESESGTRRSVIVHWDGAQWSKVPSRHPGDQDQLEDIVAITADDAWAVGSVSPTGFSRPLLEHWDGVQWATVRLRGLPGETHRLVSVSASGPRDVWAAGEYMTPRGWRSFIEHWNGIRWTFAGVGRRYSLPASSHSITAITAIAPDDVWAVRVNAPSLHWDGDVWHKVPVPPARRGRHVLHDVSGASSNNVWAVGVRNVSGTRRTLALRWRAGAWHVVPSPNPLPYSQLAGVAVSGDAVVAVGSSSERGTRFHTLIARWTGSQWRTADAPDPGSSAFLAGVDALASGRAWAVGGSLQEGQLHPLIEQRC